MSATTLPSAPQPPAAARGTGRVIAIIGGALGDLRVDAYLSGVAHNIPGRGCSS